MQYHKARAYALGRLQQELPVKLYYHGLHHTLDVCQAVNEIACQEKVAGEELLLVLTAALYHDIGFVEQYLNNEPIAARIARESLPLFNYSPEQIEIVCNIILATSIPQRPTSHLEKILCDADLDYLGRQDFFDISETLRQEWQEFGLVSSLEEWNGKQLRFFQQHQYFTQSAKEKREPLKLKHLAEIQQQVA